MERLFAEIIVDVPAEEVDRPFTYAVPRKLHSQIAVGSMVLVPFGKRREVGYVVGLSFATSYPSVSEIISIIDDHPVLTAEMIELSSWIAYYYISTQIAALRLFLAPGRRRKIVKRMVLIVKNEHIGETSLSEQEQQILQMIRSAGGDLPWEEMKKHLNVKNSYTALKKLMGKGIIESRYELTAPRIGPKREEWVELIAEINEQELNNFNKSSKQKAILEELVRRERTMRVKDLLLHTDTTRNPLRSLEKKGKIRLYKKDVRRGSRDYSYDLTQSTLNYDLNTEQREALHHIKETVEERSFKVFLLQGVTGSGKTEVYLQAIAYAVKQGRSAVVIVPEIVLTAQMVERFKKRFGERVAVMHSALGEGERFDQWQAVNRGNFDVVVGARSAIFAPLRNLGLIVVDEEQETSYKQNRNPRYHARDVAIKRANLNNAAVILGSATPSVESKYRAEKGEFKLLTLPKRVEERPQPDIEIIDMRQRNDRYIFHQKLSDGIGSALSAGDNVILFLNRRGFASFLICKDCGLSARCEQCAVSLTYHLPHRSGEKKLLKCHHCGSTRLPPQICPSCGSHNIGYFGLGTQQVETETRRLYPQNKTIRMDTDALSSKNAYIHKLVDFKSSSGAILLGTQMIAKGLDFPEVTLVGVINADTALNLPDFRASERTFQLLMQVSGRAGRGNRPGKVLIQTYAPEHYAIDTVKNGNYDSFYHREITFRKELGYPPFSKIINILFTGSEEKQVLTVATELAKHFYRKGTDRWMGVLGPASAPISKIKGRYRWHLMLKVKKEGLQKFIKESLQEFRAQRISDRVNIIVDVDPIWLL